MVRIDCALSSDADFHAGLLGQNGIGGTWVQKAKGGTLLLQNLQCLAAPLQPELVSVLRNTSHSFRLICTTTEDLEKLTDEGKFHDELFYRVAALPVVLAPLRERSADIPVLARHFAGQTTNPQVDTTSVEFTPDALAVLRGYRWPGNLTEFNQVVSKAAATTEARVITLQQLPLRLKEVQQWPSLAEFLAGQEKQYCEMVLRACNGDKTDAANVLGVDVARLG